MVEYFKRLFESVVDRDLEFFFLVENISNA